MFGFLRKKSREDILHEKYQRLMEEYFALSKTNRALSDKKYAEAQDVLLEIEKVQNL